MWKTTARSAEKLILLHITYDDDDCDCDNDVPLWVVVLAKVSNSTMFVWLVFCGYCVYMVEVDEFIIGLLNLLW